MTNKPELDIDLLNGSIAHIESLKAKTELLLGKKNLLSDAIITMDLAGHSYDYSELVVMRNSLLNMDRNTTACTADNTWNSPEDAIKSIRLAREKMQQLDDEKIRLIKEHQVKYGQDMFNQAHKWIDSDSPLPRPFLFDDYLSRERLNGVWANITYPLKQPIREVDITTTIKVTDI